MKRNILLVNVCKERLHYYEFVKPIENILSKNFVSFFVKSYNEIKNENLKKASHIIICGSFLDDFGYEKDLRKFEWIKSFEKPILGICAGMQIIGSVFSGKSKKKTEIGFYSEDFKKEFLGLTGKQEVYHLHNNSIDFKQLKEFDIFAKSLGVVQAVKHKEKEIYGVLFHPEVRQKDLIKQFVGLS